MVPCQLEPECWESCGSAPGRRAVSESTEMVTSCGPGR